VTGNDDDNYDYEDDYSMSARSNTGNRTRDLPACSTVPQSTAPPHTPLYGRIVTTMCTLLTINPHALALVNTYRLVALCDDYSICAHFN
jgi:hypothetical protein